MPCANTSVMPALRAWSTSMCIGLWSPEAPANNASVVRLIGGSVSAGRLSPTARLCRRMCWFMVGPSASGVALDDHAAQIGHVLAALVGDARLLDDELERPVLLVVDVGDVRLELQRVAGIGHAVVAEPLLAVQR